MNPTSSPSPPSTPADLAALTRSLARQVAALTLGTAALAILWNALVVMTGAVG